MGTASFAVPSLDILHVNGHEIVGVVTVPDKKAGRGQKISQSPVKEYAVAKKLNVLQPTNLKSKAFVDQLKAIDAELFVVVAFRMLPEIVWSMPKRGTLNLHSSLLPQYRGAAPINWAIINGEKSSGVSTFFIEKEIDTGDIIYQAETEIGPNENAGSLHDRLMEIGAQLVLRTIESIDQGDSPRIKQDTSRTLKHAPKIFKEDCMIDWSKSIHEVHNFVRGLSPYPVAWSSFEDKSIRIIEAEKEIVEHAFDFGTIVCDDKKSMKIACNGGFLKVLELQLQGKKRMKTVDFRNGVHLNEGARLV